ncbi:class I SAM-dependent methyltransferase [Tsukamurella sp. 8F]|uniref:class I SAM-dependent methyltransferase n=1 Tax=unclassified Tsukamurella TaxID=2633480 RepID=UPI0023B99934|nr:MULTISPECIES: class I SAM-dependent methyltransferase [unclassified Tsukamurella]MDF0532162.1 class I SAM-dependent methyltransferase [Tsukamurella sp. 8J]MDF0589446.1 class I SAM-dependent methyltransferase [Tsukamurella sp. 8F]
MEQVDGTTLTGVSTTTLWTLRNRAEEAAREDSSFSDPLAEDLYAAIRFDYAAFGGPSQSHALRARAADAFIERYLDRRPDATVVALGEGLQTSYWRIRRPIRRWLSVDLEPVIELRRRLLPDESAVEHIAMSALDRAWMDGVDPEDGVVITAEGLFMYFEPDEVTALIGDMAQRFPGGELFYDSIPPWLSARTKSGRMRLRGGYTAPPMPYWQTVGGAQRLLEIPGVEKVEDVSMPLGRGAWRWAPIVIGALSRIPAIRDKRPSFTRITFGKNQIR